MPLRPEIFTNTLKAFLVVIIILPLGFKFLAIQAVAAGVLLLAIASGESTGIDQYVPEKGGYDVEGDAGMGAGRVDGAEDGEGVGGGVMEDESRALHPSPVQDEELVVRKRGDLGGDAVGGSGGERWRESSRRRRRMGSRFSVEEVSAAIGGDGEGFGG